MSTWALFRQAYGGLPGGSSSGTDLGQGNYDPARRSSFYGDYFLRGTGQIASSLFFGGPEDALVTNIVATSAVKGALEDALVAAIAATTTAKGTLENALKASIVATTTLVAPLETRLAASVAALGAVKGTLENALQASIASAATTKGTLESALQASIVATTTLTAPLETRLAASIAAVTTVKSTLESALKASIVARSTVGGLLETALQAAITAASAVSGGLEAYLVAVDLGVSIAARSTVSAYIPTSVAANIVATTALSGRLESPLRAQIVAGSSVQGQLESALRAAIQASPIVFGTIDLHSSQGNISTTLPTTSAQQLVFPLRRYAAIPEPIDSIEGMFEPVRMLKENVEILTGQRGEEDDWAVSLDTLISLNMLTKLNGIYTPTPTTRRPVFQMAASGAVMLDRSKYVVYKLAVMGNVTKLELTGWEPVGMYGELMVDTINSGTFSVTWPSNTKWVGGAVPTVSSGRDRYRFSSDDGGQTVLGDVIGRDYH